jgi:hypothetical protein
MKERRKTMSTPELWPPTYTEYDRAESEDDQAEVEDKEREQMQEQLPPDLLLKEEEVENRERELKRDFHTPLGGTYLFTYLIIFVLLLVGFALLFVFHLI